MSIDPRISRAFAASHGFPLERHLIVLGLMGSHSHGTYLPPEDPDAIDDVDLMGLVIPPLAYHLGLPRWEHWVYKEDELDVVLYSLDKAVRLLLKGNPNILGLLWLSNDGYVERHPLFDRLQAKRQLFSSRAVGDAFSGYAYGQLKRMEAFDLERMAEYEALSAALSAHGAPAEVLAADAHKLAHLAAAWHTPVDTLQRFRALHRQHFSGYMGAKRKAMVRRHQYDVKNAAHLIRLLRMGIEFLETGVLEVHRRHDADELKQIKRGGWTLAQVKAEAERLFALVDQARLRSPLARKPDEGAANELLLALHLEALALTGRPAPVKDSPGRP